MDYTNLSDFEINKLVAEALGLELSDGQHYKPTIGVFIKGFFQQNDYCNNPSDAWPIILENKISVECYTDDTAWLSSNRWIKHQHRHENPLRAAMVVFLMISEVSNG